MSDVQPASTPAAAATPQLASAEPAAPSDASATATAASSSDETSLKRKASTDAPASSADAAAVGGTREYRAGSDHRGGRGGKRGRGGRGGGGGRGGHASRAETAREGEDGLGLQLGLSASPAVPPVPPVPQTPVQQQFQLFAAYLDERVREAKREEEEEERENDRREQVFQSSRDLTRASKKLITQLQRCTHAASPSDRARMLAAARRDQLAELHRMLAATIEGFKPEEYHRYAGAYSPGFQEFVEAATFLHYLEHGTLLTHGELEAEIAQTLGHRITMPLSDYIVGALDLGGELMRYATNSVTTGDRDIVLSICTFLRAVYAEYQRLSALPLLQGGSFRELPKKMEVWMQSLQKIETLAYKLHIRGAEIPDSRMLSSMLMHDLGGGGGGRGGGGEFDEGGGQGGGGGDE